MANQSSGSLNAADEVVLLAVGAAGTIGVQVVNSFSGTLSFEGTVNGSTWAAISLTPIVGGAAVSSTTAAGQWSGGCAGLLAARVRMSAYTSGIAEVWLLANQAGAAAGGAAVSGSVTATASGYKNATWSANHAPAANTKATITKASAGTGVSNVCTGFTVAITGPRISGGRPRLASRRSRGPRWSLRRRECGRSARRRRR